MEIENEPIVKKTPCQFCGNKFKNTTNHERFCKLNPANISDQKGGSDVDKTSPEPEISHDIINKLAAEDAIIITDVQPYNINPESPNFDAVAWYQDDQGKRTPLKPMFIGIHNNIPTVLIMTQYGQLFPPYLLPGFIGMFPKYHEFPEHEQTPEPVTQEQIPDAPIIALGEPIKSPQNDEKATRVIIPPENAPKQKKKSLLARVFSRKEKKTKSNEDPQEMKDLLREVASSGKAV